LDYCVARVFTVTMFLVVFSLITLLTIPSAYAINTVIDFQSAPGTDGIFGTQDDTVYDPSSDTFGTNPPCRLIDDEYDTIGVHFNGLELSQAGGVWNPDGTTNSGNMWVISGLVASETTCNRGPQIKSIIINFDNPQTEVTFDLFAQVSQSSPTAPVKITHADLTITQISLDNSDAVLGGTNQYQLRGRFTISDSLNPIIGLEFQQTPPGGTIHLTNIQFDVPASSPTPTIAINDVSMAEGNSGTTNFVFTVTRSGVTTGTSSVNFASANGGATATLTAPGGPDYNLFTTGMTTLNFAAGQITKTITVLVNGDTVVELDETFYVYLSSCSGCTISDNQGIGTIINDDLVAPSTVFTITPANGTGTVIFSVPNGTFTNMTAISVNNASSMGSGFPTGVSFPYGFFSWILSGISPGDTVTVTIEFPGNMPVGSQFWKLVSNVWTDVTSILGDDDGDSILTLTITDGGFGDADGTVNGQITDPGGLASALRTKSPQTTSGRDTTEQEPTTKVTPGVDVSRAEVLPKWIKNNADWWAEGTITDSDFTKGIEYMIKEDVIHIKDLPQSTKTAEPAQKTIPKWIRNNAAWWADGIISEKDFVNGLKYLVENGIIKVESVGIKEEGVK